MAILLVDVSSSSVLVRWCTSMTRPQCSSFLRFQLQGDQEVAGRSEGLLVKKVQENKSNHLQEFGTEFEVICFTLLCFLPTTVHVKLQQLVSERSNKLLLGNLMLSANKLQRNMSRPALRQVYSLLASCSLFFCRHHCSY